MIKVPYQIVADGVRGISYSVSQGASNGKNSSKNRNGRRKGEEEEEGSGRNKKQRVLWLKIYSDANSAMKKREKRERERRERREKTFLCWKILLIYMCTLVHTHDTLQFILYFLKDPQTTLFSCSSSTCVHHFIHHIHFCHLGNHLQLKCTCTTPRLLSRSLLNYTQRDE